MFCISEEVQTLNQIMKMGILYFTVFLQATFQALIKINMWQKAPEN